MLKLWLLYAIVSIADLFLTWFFLTPSLEANPTASWIWSRLGYEAVVIYKVICVCFVVYPCCKIIEAKNKLIASCLLCFGIFVTTVTCALFLMIIL